MDVKEGANNQIPWGPSAGDIIFLPSEASGNALARLDLNGFNATVNGLNAITANAPNEASVADFGSTNSTLSFGANNATAQFNGTVADSGVGKALSLNKIGAGTQTFNNAMNHFGTTTVSAGTLALTGTATLTNTPSISVAAGATFDPSGIGGFTVGTNQTLNCIGGVNGSLTINGKLSPFMTAIGTLSIGSPVTFDSASTYVWDMNNATGAAGTDPGWSLLDAVFLQRAHAAKRQRGVERGLAAHGRQ
ncbi:MAG: autotransporter-associated beta strand repeat-containing protein [Xanthobacteraceae bacterium]